jgi:hypothetical protein
VMCAIRPAEATIEWPKGTYLPEQRVEECAHGRHNKTCNPKREYVGDWTTQAPQPHIVTKSLRNTCVATAEENPGVTHRGGRSGSLHPTGWHGQFPRL